MIELTLGTPWAARCTKSMDSRYTVGKVYVPICVPHMNDGWMVVDNEGHGGASANTYEDWYRMCCWTYYDFEEVQVVKPKIGGQCL